MENEKKLKYPVAFLCSFLILHMFLAYSSGPVGSSVINSRSMSQKEGDNMSQEKFFLSFLRADIIDHSVRPIKT